jgi:hypothetical protein
MFMDVGYRAYGTYLFSNKFSTEAAFENRFLGGVMFFIIVNYCFIPFLLTYLEYYNDFLMCYKFVGMIN